MEELNFQSNDNYINLQDDFYAMCNVAYIYSANERDELIEIEDPDPEQKLIKDPRTGGVRFIGDKELASYFKSAFFIFLIQMAIAGFCSVYAFNNPEAASGKIPEG